MNTGVNPLALFEKSQGHGTDGLTSPPSKDV